MTDSDNDYTSSEELADCLLIVEFKTPFSEEDFVVVQRALTLLFPDRVHVGKVKGVQEPAPLTDIPDRDEFEEFMDRCLGKGTMQ